MGGHGHAHHEPYTIPDYKIYKIENCPELIATQKALAARGLQDPWLRNEVWRFDKNVWGTLGSRVRPFFFTGFRTGFIAFVATIVGTSIYDAVFPSDHGHSHEEEGGHH